MYTCVKTQITPSPQDPFNGNFLDLEHGAGYIGTTVRHMRRLVAERRIPSYRVGKFVRFSRSRPRRVDGKPSDRGRPVTDNDFLDVGHPTARDAEDTLEADGGGCGPQTTRISLAPS